MRLKSMQLIGFQSFSDTGKISFGNGMNLVIGQNNVGKSALLRALQRPLRDDRHRSATRWQQHTLAQPRLLTEVEITGEEFADEGLRRGTFAYPLLDNEPAQAEQFLAILKKTPVHYFPLVTEPQQTLVQRDPSHGLWGVGRTRSNIWTAVITASDGELRLSSIEISHTDTIPTMIDAIWQRSMFYFSAERLTVGQHAHARAERLTPNASNLPAVLHTLNGSRGSLFRRLVGHLREVFPSTVGNLSVQPLESTPANEIRVWPTEAQDHAELSFSLNDSGTGVAQVIAILTAVMTVDNAVIVIDEINSFMHPAAIKILLRILQTEYAQHQYIISTHAPEVISFSNPDTVHLVSRDGYESTIGMINLDDIAQLRDVADHLGVSMSDVFAADRVIWVEGPTEEICFPFIYKELVGPLPRGTLITSVVATGDLGGKQRTRDLVIDIYKRLSSAAQPLVSRVVFSFDAETWTDEQRHKMRQESGEALYFLPRRLFECYLIDAAAIADFINARDESQVTADAVAYSLKELAAELPLKVAGWNGDLTNEVWLKNVDAANLIDQCMGIVSEQRVRFNKKRDALELLKSVMQMDKSKLLPLAEYLKGLVEAVSR